MRHPSQYTRRLQAERDTIKEREALEAEEAAALEAERLRLEARKLQTKEIVVDTIAKEEAAARAAAEVRACASLLPLPGRLHTNKPISFLRAALQMADAAPEHGCVPVVSGGLVSVKVVAVCHAGSEGDWGH